MDCLDRWPAHRQLIAVTAMLGLGGCASPEPPSKMPFTVTDLGTLGGPISSAREINNLGEAVGRSGTKPFGQGGTEVGYVWTPQDGMVDIGQLSGTEFGSAGAINDLGQVTVQLAGRRLQSHAFLWTPGIGVRELGNLGKSKGADSFAEAGSYAADINNRGQVVGGSSMRVSQDRAFLWTSKGGMQDLGTLGGQYSKAAAINDLGQVVGWSRTAKGDDHAFLWTATAGMRDLGTLGGSKSMAIDINNLGEIVGQSTTAPESNYKHAFLWTQGKGMEDIHSSNARSSSATGINDLGQVVGDVSGRAFLWTPQDGMMELPELARSHSSAASINNRGQIVGESAANWEPVSIMHAVLWTLPFDQAPPDEVIAAVEAEVGRLFAEAPDRREAQVLTTKLNVASWQLHRGNVRGAFRILESLIVYVRTARWLGSLTAEEAGQLDGWLGEAADRVAAKQPATDSLWEIPRHPETVVDPPDLVAELDSPQRTSVAPGGGHDIRSPVVVDGKAALRGAEWIQIYPHGGGLPETTPGVQLALEEVAREGESSTKVSFRIAASGFPTDKTYQLFSYSLSQYNEGLKPVSLGEFSPDALPRMAIQEYTGGEWLQVALISSDLTIAAFAEAIPFPIEAKSGSCRIWLKLISSVGIQFTVHGEGYEAGEPVTTVWHIEEATMKDTWEADSAGSFRKALMHGLRVTEGGLATFSATGRSCDLLLEYEWGQRAMM